MTGLLRIKGLLQPLKGGESPIGFFKLGKSNTIQDGVLWSLQDNQMSWGSLSGGLWRVLARGRELLLDLEVQ